MFPPKRHWVFVFILFGVLSVFGMMRLEFVYDFQRFFPKNDTDLDFYLDFREKFEGDDNFLLLAVKNPKKNLEQEYLLRLRELTESLDDIPEIETSVSIATLEFPIIMGDISVGGMVIMREALRINKPQRYAKDSAKMMKDPRLRGRFFEEDLSSFLILMRVQDTLELNSALAVVDHTEGMAKKYGFDDHHILGLANFLASIVEIQKKEFVTSAILAGVLVMFILIIVFRTPVVIMIAIVSIGLGMLVFTGILGLAGAKLDALATLYPILMIIVGTSDVVHFISRYQNELRIGTPKKEAMRLTIKEIGWATFLTSFTTAIGFIALVTSKISPIQQFGLWSALGVIVAYICVLFFTTSALSLFGKKRLIPGEGKWSIPWERYMENICEWTRIYPKQIAVGFVLFLVLCVVGISKISMNYGVEDNMPRGYKVTTDFRYFEDHYFGFRPYEVSVEAKQGDMTSYQVLREIEKLDQYLQNETSVANVSSLSSLYKSLNVATKGNRLAYYKFPDSAQFQRLATMLSFTDSMAGEVLISRDKKFSRVSGSLPDVGAETLRAETRGIERWMDSNLDTSVVTTVQTGMGMMIDKNSQYAMDSLLKGLGLALFLISVLMALLFRDIKFWIIALIPNVFPLILAAAFFGWLGINLDASISIIFAIIFGIAVDDTIHFLSKFKICRDKGMDVESSLKNTFRDTGKAIVLTSLILFLGFLVLLFSSHPPTNYTGILIGLTLAGALIADFLTIPLLIRYWFKD